MRFHVPFRLDGRPRAFEVNRVEADGRRWVNVMNTQSFGIGSSAWTGARRKKGLQRQAEEQLRAARQNLAHGHPPVVAFDFVNVVSDEVAAALRSMGAEVAGIELTLTTDRIREGVLEAPFARAYEVPEVTRSRHAMWWVDGTDTRDAYARSDARVAINRAYRAMSGIESETFTLLLRSMGAIALRAPRVELLDETACFTARADDVGFHLLVSRDRGCRLVFPTERTTSAACGLVWSRFADFAERGRAWLGSPAHQPSEIEEWWTANDDSAARDHASAIGVILPSVARRSK